MTLTRRQQIEALEKDWATNPRWKNVKRTYTARRSRRTAWLDGTSKYNSTTWC